MTFRRLGIALLVALLAPLGAASDSGRRQASVGHANRATELATEGATTDAAEHLREGAIRAREAGEEKLAAALPSRRQSPACRRIQPAVGRRI